MTSSIDAQTRAKAATPPGSEPVTDRRSRLTVAVATFTVVTGTAGACGMAAAFVLEEWRTALLGATLMLLAGMGAQVLCQRAFLASKEIHYQRGQLDGWYRGYRMQPPEIDDPLLQ